jgi:hypothetical protein
VSEPDLPGKLSREYSGLVAVGPVPTSSFPRWGRWVQAPLDGLPPVKEYRCLRAPEKIRIDGRLDGKVWQKAPWSDPFGTLATGEGVEQETRISLLWDDQCLYAAYRVEDHDIRGTMTGFHDHVYMNDEDVELFLEGDGFYYELGVNPINTVYEIKWTWVQPLVERGEYAALEDLFMTPNYIYFLAREGERMGRHGDLDWELPGLAHAVHIDGTLNRPEVKDKGWTVELAIPWAGLAPLMGGRPLPPKTGDSMRITAYRAHHSRDESEQQHTTAGWAWSVTGNDNIHVPERWNRIVFLDESPWRKVKKNGS